VSSPLPLFFSLHRSPPLFLSCRRGVARHGRGSAEPAQTPSSLLPCLFSPRAGRSRAAASTPALSWSSCPWCPATRPPLSCVHLGHRREPVSSRALARRRAPQVSEPPRPSRCVLGTPSTPPWLAMVTELPSPTPPMSLQPAPVVRLPSPCLGLAVSHVVHVKSRVRSASPCHRSRVVQLVHALAFACAQCVDGTPSTLVYRSSTPRLHLVYPPYALVSLAIVRASHLKSSRAVRACCVCCSHASSCVLRKLIIRLT
jgi:hypothetical protein